MLVSKASRRIIDSVKERTRAVKPIMNPKGTRRVWTIDEEEALLKILEDVVTQGSLCDSGCLKPGTMTVIELALKNLCPESGLKAVPHIESKLRKWKKHYRIISDMLTQNGFSWNDAKKCVEVDNYETWQSYLQVNKDAERWRYKPFPLYSRFAQIYGKDWAIEKREETPIDIVEVLEELNQVEANGTNITERQENSSPMSMNQTSTAHHPTPSLSKKRARQPDNLISELHEVVASFKQIFEQLCDRMQMLTKPVGIGSDDYKEIAEELNKMSLSVDHQIDAITLMVEKPQYVHVFKALNAAVRKAFVMKILRERLRC